MRFKIICVILLVSTVAFAKGKKIPVIKVPSGSNIPAAGMALDASYDAATDGIIPGYKILSVAITNSSIDIIQMNQVYDKWLVVDVKGKKHNAITSLKEVDSEAFLLLKPRLRQLIEYPVMVQVGETKVIDLLFKDSVNLDGFRAVKYTSAITRRTFEIMAQD